MGSWNIWGREVLKISCLYHTHILHTYITHTLPTNALRNLKNVFQKFLINIFSFFLVLVFYGNTFKISIFGYYEINNRGVGNKTGGL